MGVPHRLVSAVLLLFSSMAAYPAMARDADGTIALTFDDLPALTILSDQSYVDDLTVRLLRGLERHHFPATGFVNAGKLDDLQRNRQVANLARWLDAGMGLGNHTFSHGSPNEIGAAAYIADIERGEPVLRELLTARGQDLRWFRHPYLETGYPAATKQAIDTWLSAHGYRIAPVTIDADDWEFAEPYDDAVAHHDRKRRRAIMRAYLQYTAIRVDWSKRAARVLFSRDIAQVILLHGTRLNADALDRLAAIFRSAGLRPVSLEDAMRDPVYRTADPYVTKDGLNWLERWAAARGKTLPSEGDVDPPAWIRREYDKVDNDKR